MDAINIIRFVAPEFSNVLDEELRDWIELVSPMVSRKKFGNMYSYALAYLVCHKMKMAGLGESAYGSGSGISGITAGLTMGSVSDGGTSISFANPVSGGSSSSDSEYLLSAYGMQYLTLRKQFIVPITISGV